VTVDVLTGMARAIRGTLGLVVVVVMTGCTSDLRAIREFATVSAESARYEELVDDYVGFPQRKKLYQGPTLHPQLEDEHKAREFQRNLLLLRLGIIREYMDALGALAADDLVVFDQQVEGLTQNISAMPGVSKEEVETYSGLGKALSKAATNHWRQKELRDLIENSHGAFDSAINMLKKFVQVGPVADADDERIVANRYYKDAIRSSNDSGAKIALEEWRRYHLAEIKGRAISATDYVAVLEEIKGGHQRLYDQRNQLDSKALAVEIREIAKQVKNLYMNVK